MFYARSLHKYDGNSFHHIDPYFGPIPTGDLALMAKETSDPATWHWTAADKLFLELVRQAHARKIRVIIDGVFNHTGRDFFAFADLRKRQADSPYRDWYIVQAFRRPGDAAQRVSLQGLVGRRDAAGVRRQRRGRRSAPRPQAVRFRQHAGAGWTPTATATRPTASTAGGWTWPTKCRPASGATGTRTRARSIPQCYTVAEIWDDARQFLEDGQFSATMNYHGFAFPVKGFLDRPGAAAERRRRSDLDARRNGYPRPVQYALQNLIDSHDTDRLASMIVNAGRRPYAQPDRFDYDIGVSPRYVPDYDVRKPNDDERRVQRLVALLQMTYVGAPMIYYGTEAGMWGADDPCDRMPMVWPDLTYEPQQADPLGRERPADAVAFDESLFDFYRAAIALRRDSAALRRGIIEFVAADDAAQFLAFRRADEKESLLVGTESRRRNLSLGSSRRRRRRHRAGFHGIGQRRSVFHRAPGRPGNCHDTWPRRRRAAHRRKHSTDELTSVAHSKLQDRDQHERNRGRLRNAKQIRRAGCPAGIVVSPCADCSQTVVIGNGSAEFVHFRGVSCDQLRELLAGGDIEQIGRTRVVARSVISPARRPSQCYRSTIPTRQTRRPEQRRQR